MSSAPLLPKPLATRSPCLWDDSADNNTSVEEESEWRQIARGEALAESVSAVSS